VIISDSKLTRAYALFIGNTYFILYYLPITVRTQGLVSGYHAKKCALYLIKYGSIISM